MVDAATRKSSLEKWLMVYELVLILAIGFAWALTSNLLLYFAGMAIAIPFSIRDDPGF